jgi:GGDEF domain-containing protein
VLKEVAYQLRKQLRAFDLAYRLGGEEFLILLRRVAARRALRLRRGLQGRRRGAVPRQAQRARPRVPVRRRAGTRRRRRPRLCLAQLSRRHGREATPHRQASGSWRSRCARA